MRHIDWLKQSLPTKRKGAEAARVLRRAATSNAVLLAGGTFALGLLVGRYWRRAATGAEVTFEPEGSWGFDGEGEPNSDGAEPPRAARAAVPAARVWSRETPSMALEDAELAADVPLEPARPERAMTPDIENISADHPSEAPVTGASVRDGGETPVRTAFPGHETRGPGVRTGSSGAAALDAGSGGPRMGERDRIRTRRRRPGEDVG